MTVRTKAPKIDRRSLMLAGGSVAVAAISPHANAVPVAPPPAQDFSSYALQNQTPAQLANALNPTHNRYIAEKHRLLSKYSWLNAFDQDLTADGLIYSTLTDPHRTVRKYDPFQIESLIRSTSDLLDRCLVNRRDIYQLEEESIRYCMDYDLFNEQSPLLKSIELADYLESQRLIEKAGQTTAAAKFHHSDDPLGDGFEAVSRTAAASSGKAALGESDRKTKVEAKWKTLTDYQLALADRHTTPGCALNYTERYARLCALLQQDIRISYDKLRCIEFGLGQIFGLTPTSAPISLSALPHPTPNGYLDLAVLWLREAIEVTGLATIEEIDFNHVVPLCQGRPTKDDRGGTYSVVQPQDWHNAFAIGGSGTVTFSLGSEFPSTVKHLRLKGIGVSILLDRSQDDQLLFGGQKELFLRGVPAIVFPPRVIDLDDHTKFISRPPLAVACANWFNALTAESIVHPYGVSLDPRTDSWTIKINVGMLTTIGIPYPREDYIKDVFLHLSLAGIFENNPALWSQNLDWGSY